MGSQLKLHERDILYSVTIEIKDSTTRKPHRQEHVGLRSSTKLRRRTGDCKTDLKSVNILYRVLRP